MKKYFVAFFALAILALALPALAAPPPAPADGLKMDKTKQNVIFNHSTHKDTNCVECHHAVDGKEDYRKCSTAGCHDNLDRKEKGVHGYYRAMHNKADTKFTTCVSCHLQIVEKAPDKKKELTACKQSKCHP